MHGSEDIKHHHRWYYMLQALELEEANRAKEGQQSPEKSGDQKKAP